MRPHPFVAVLLALAALPSSAHRRVVLAVDGSGSMKEAAGGVSVGESLSAFAGKLQPSDELAIVVFDERASLLRAPGPVGGHAAVIDAQVRGISQDGQHSDLPAGLALACDAFAPDAKAPVDVILVTDGVITVRPPRAAAEAVAELQSRIVPRCVDAGVRVHVIGVGGRKADTTTLQSLAEATRGQAEFPLASGRVAQFFDEYLAATAPPPPPQPTAQAPPRATASVPPPPALGAGTIAAIAIGVVLAVLGLALAWLRRRRAPLSPAHGLIVLKEFPGGTEHSLKLPAIIGRSPSSAIMLDDKEVSRKHLRIEESDGKVVAVDLGSANGTFVNDARLKEGLPRVLRPGDRLKLPGLELHVKAEMDPESTYIRQDLDRTFIRPTQPEKT